MEGLNSSEYSSGIQIRNFTIIEHVQILFCFIKRYNTRSMKLLAGLLLAGGTYAEENECRPANQKICENISTIPNESDAVCGSDGITYSNQCLFKHYKCITGVVVQKRHNGPCAGEERLTDKDFFNGPLVKHHCPVKCHKSNGS